MLSEETQISTAEYLLSQSNALKLKSSGTSCVVAVVLKETHPGSVHVCFIFIFAFLGGSGKEVPDLQTKKPKCWICYLVVCLGELVDSGAAECFLRPGLHI